MAMEKRQQDIQVGAGLTESRYSQDFIDLLKTWSLPTVLIIAAGVLAIQGWRLYKNRQETSLAAAFKDVEGAVVAGNPTNLVRLAEEHAGKRAVPWMARLTAADILMQAAVSGVAPGAEIDTDGKPKNEADVLKPEQVQQKYDEAAAQYRIVLNETADSRGNEPHALSAAFGLAAVAESRGKWDEARQMYDRAINIADRGGFKAAQTLIKDRIASLDKLKETGSLLSDAQVLTRYDAVKLAYNITPDTLAQGAGVEPMVTRADGTQVPSKPAYDFEPMVIRKRPAPPAPPAAPKTDTTAPANPAAQTPAPSATTPAPAAATPAPTAPAPTTPAPKP